MAQAAHIALACIQAKVSLDDYLTVERFQSLVDRLMRQAAAVMPDDVPRLVVFPEDFASGCIFAGEADVLPQGGGLRAAVAALVRRHFAGVMTQRLKHRVGWVRALALHRAATVAEIYFDTFAAAARRYGTYVLGGTVLLPRLDDKRQPQGSDVYNTAYLFGPDGKVIGAQRKAFLIELEGPEGLDLATGSVEELTAWDTELGRIAVAVCFDAFQEPVIERLAALNPDILLQPSANPQPWNDWQQEDWLRGSWHAVCQRGIARYGVNPMLVGSLLDISFEGQSAILDRELARTQAEPLPAQAPGYAALAPRPGFVQVAGSWTEEEVLVVTLPHPAR